MLGILYLFLCFTVGWVFCTYAFPNLNRMTERSFENKEITVSPYLLLLPAWFVSGVLIVTWALYLTASLFAGSPAPLTYANMIVLPIAAVISAATYYIRHFRHQAEHLILLHTDERTARIEMFFLAGITVLASVLMWKTFFINQGQLYIGISVFSDFSPHIGMIRSFSYGNNFPTAYSHFGGEDIRYHFMFQFLVGNLEFLGLPLDYAFNLPSILSFLSAFLLLYVLAVKITGRVSVGVLSCLFFAFRSSKSLFTYLSAIPKDQKFLKTLIENKNFIGDTPHEDWGLWNLNVYCNQRHLAFGLSAIFFVLILFLPYLYERFESLKILRYQRSELKKINPKNRIKLGQNLFIYIKQILFTKEDWMIKDWRIPVASGILLGSLSFFHGAAVIGCLLLLFMIAVLAKHRMAFVITAVLTLGLSFLQTHYFIDGSVVSAKLLFGFIAENKTLFGVLIYLNKLLGILPLVLIIAFIYEKGAARYLYLAFCLPLLFAFMVSLTVDVTVNHKYIMMSVILFGIYAASLIVKIFDRKKFLFRFIGIILIILLTSSGIYDFYTVLNRNTSESALILKLNDPLTEFVRENSDSKDLFLTANYTINQLVLGGAMLFQGHQYYAWSAGYDTYSRDKMVQAMYQAKTPSELDKLVKENKIRYIVVDRDNRYSTEYVLNEDNISTSYQCVYSEGEGEWKTSIYDTEKLLIK